jgi:hypothetical protein
VNEFYIEGTEPVQQCSGLYGATTDSGRIAPAPPPAPFGQPIDPNTVRPRAGPVPAPAPPPRDTARRGQFDPFHPGKP